MRRFNENYRLVASDLSSSGVTVLIRSDTNCSSSENKTSANPPSVVQYCKGLDQVKLFSSDDVSQLGQESRNIEEELDQVKFEIIKIVTDKNDFSKENAILKSYQPEFASLSEQNELLKQKLTAPSAMLDLSVLESPETDRTSPDGQEIEGNSRLMSVGLMEMEEIGL